MRVRRSTLLVAFALTACGRIGYAPREVGVLDASVDAFVATDAPMPCGSVCLGRPAMPEPFGSAPALSQLGHPISLASDGGMLFGAFTQGMSSPFALHVAAFTPSGARGFDVPLDLSVSANDHALAVLPSGLAVGYVRTTGAAAIETRLSLVSAATGTMTQTVSIDTRSSALRGLYAGSDGLGVTWLRGSVAVPTASFFQLRDEALQPVGTTVTLPVDAIPSAVAEVDSAWFVGAASTTSNQARLIRTRDLSSIALPTWPSACGTSAGAVLAAGCSGALVCWRDTSTCGAASEVVDRCALMQADGTLASPTLLYSGPHAGSADIAALAVRWTGSEFFVRSAFDDGERFALFDRAGVMRQQFEDLTVRSQGAEGDVVWLNGCAHAVTFNAELLVRRACASTCM